MLKIFKLPANKLETTNANLIRTLKDAKAALENLYNACAVCETGEKIDRFHREACQKNLLFMQ